MMGPIRYLPFLAAVFAFGMPGPAPAGQMVDITVAQGETLRALCRQHLEDPGRCPEVYRVNLLRNPDRIHPGQRIMVPAELLRGIPAGGVVAFVKGDVRYYRAEGDLGRSPGTGESLEEGGRIETGEDGVVEITFTDGTSFLLRPNSVVSLVRIRDKGGVLSLRDIFLRAGRVVSRIRRATGREQRFNILTPSAVAGARGTEFRVSLDTEETTRSEVLTGAVAVKAMGNEIRVHEGEGTGVRKGERPQPPRPLLPPPAPLGLEPVYTSEPLRMGVTVVPGAAAFRAVLARDPVMRDVVREQVVPAGAAFEVSGVADGSYFLETTSIDGNGLEGKPAAPVPVVIRFNPKPPHVEAPQDLAEYQGTKVTARWLRVGDAAGYYLQVAGDRGFSAPLFDQKVEGNEREVELGYGSYRFRVASVAADGFQGEWSDILSFSLIRPPPTPLPEEPRTDGEQMRIRARDAGKGFSYRFQVARDDLFTALLHDETGPAPELVIPRPEPGTYYFRTSCIDAKGREGNFSIPQSFVIEPPFPYATLGVIGGIMGFIVLLAL